MLRAVGVPLVAGAFTIHYERRSTFSFEAAVSVFALFSVIVFVAFVWINAARGERADRLRRKAERALRLSEERHQLNFETALDGIIMIDRDGRIITRDGGVIVPDTRDGDIAIPRRVPRRDDDDDDRDGGWWPF